MRPPFAAALIITILGSSLYVYREAQAVCDAPLSYQIGEIDERFGITLEEARLAIADAESVWEEATGENLFTYDPEGELVINFVFNVQQAFYDEQEKLIQTLDATLDIQTSVFETYEEKNTEFEALTVEYAKREADYLSRLDAYNAKIAEYELRDDVSPEEIVELEAEEKWLSDEQIEINALNDQIAQLSEEVNDLTDKIDQLVTRYNETNSIYNEYFAGEHQYIPGVYSNNEINIFKFSSAADLHPVLVHELGHALSLDHIADTSAIMHAFLDNLPADPQLNESDLLEYERVCGQTAGSFFERLAIRFGL